MYEQLFLKCPPLTVQTHSHTPHEVDIFRVLPSNLFVNLSLIFSLFLFFYFPIILFSLTSLRLAAVPFTRPSLFLDTLSGNFWLEGHKEYCISLAWTRKQLSLVQYLLAVASDRATDGEIKLRWGFVGGHLAKSAPKLLWL